MDEARKRRARQMTSESQVRRAQRGIVAAYIHQLSERHGSHAASRADGELPSESGEEA
jgi:hypothetical protein